MPLANEDGRAIAEWIGARKGVAPPGPDVALRGLLDSVDYLELLLMLEERFGLRTNPFDVTPAELGTVAAVAAFVASRQAAP